MSESVLSVAWGLFWVFVLLLSAAFSWSLKQGFDQIIVARRNALARRREEKGSEFKQVYDTEKQRQKFEDAPLFAWLKEEGIADRPVTEIASRVALFGLIGLILWVQVVLALDAIHAFREDVAETLGRLNKDQAPVETVASAELEPLPSPYKIRVYPAVAGWTMPTESFVAPPTLLVPLPDEWVSGERLAPIKNPDAVTPVVWITIVESPLIDCAAEAMDAWERFDSLIKTLFSRMGVDARKAGLPRSRPWQISPNPPDTGMELTKRKKLSKDDRDNLLAHGKALFHWLGHSLALSEMEGFEKIDGQNELRDVITQIREVFRTKPKQEGWSCWLPLESNQQFCLIPSQVQVVDGKQRERLIDLSDLVNLQIKKLGDWKRDARFGEFGQPKKLNEPSDH